MHYCQLCETPVLLEPCGDEAVCPAGHAGEPARRLPLFVVTGASGAGKTSIFPFLTAELDEFAVFDVDWLMDSFGAACAPGPIDWVAFRDAWLSVAHGLAQGGRVTVLLSPVMPEQLQDLPARRWITEIHFALLDCPDTARVERLANRPAWRARDIDEQLAFAAHLRTQIPTVIRTDGAAPESTAATVASWIRDLTASAAGAVHRNCSASGQ